MSSNNDGNRSSGRKQLPPCGWSTSSAVSKSMEGGKKSGKMGLQAAASRWHSAPTAGRDDEDRHRPSGSGVLPPSPVVFKTTAVIEVAASGAGAAGGGWKPLQRQKVVTTASTLDEDEDAIRAASVASPATTADGEHDGSGAVAVTADRVRKRVVTVRRGYSCQETCAARRSTATAVGCGCSGGANGAAGPASGASENRRRWLSADTGSGQTGGNSKSMECLPPQPSQPHHRTSFIMAADDRKSLDSGLDDVAAAEMADRRRGMFASTRTSVPSHLSLALPSSERRLTILSPHTHTPSTPAAYSSSAVESVWHFCTSSVQQQQQQQQQVTGAASATACRSRKKGRPGMVLPRLVLPGSSDLDIFSQ